MTIRTEDIKTHRNSGVSQAAQTARTKSAANEPNLSQEIAGSAQNVNTDTLKNTNQSVAQIYKQIETYCVKYNFTMEDAKKAGLLETIAGCSTEDLVKKSPEEIKKYVNALEKALPFELFSWGDKDISWIKKIANKANNKYISEETGISWFRNAKRNVLHFFGVNTNLGAKLKDKGYDNNSAGVKDYFQEILQEAISSKDPVKIQKAYNEALATYGEFLQDTDDPAEKELLMSAISKLEAGKRTLAARLGVASCKDNIEARHAAARGIAANMKAITCSADALGGLPSDDDTQSISFTAYSNMTEEDSLSALNSMKSDIKAIEEKIAKGEEISEEDKLYYEKAKDLIYSGALTGSLSNSYYENKNNVLSTINNDTTEFGIKDKVYSKAQEYISKYGNEISITAKDIEKAESLAQNPTNNNSTSSQTTSVKQEPAAKNTETPTAAKGEDEEIVSSKKENTTTASETKKTEEKKQTTETDKANTTTNPIEKPAPKTLEEALASNDTKVVKEFQKSNNISNMELVVETFNSSNVSNANERQALENFKLMDCHQQEMAYTGIKRARGIAKILKSNVLKDEADVKDRSYDFEKLRERIQQA